MASTARSTLGRRFGVLIAGVVVATTLTAATAPAAPTPQEGPAGGPVPGASQVLGPPASNDPEPGSPGTARRPSAAPSAFIYRKGRYTPLDAVDGRPTAHTSINNRGQIAGGQLEPDGTARGFVRDQRGTYTSFDAAPGVPTIAYGINDHGTAVGTYGVTEAHGFLRKANGAVITIDVPGASDTNLYGINDRGQVVGGYRDADGRAHGFLLQRGQLTVIDHPESPDDPASRNTSAVHLNDRGQIVGYYTDATGTYHGYLYHKGRFTRIDPPGAAEVARFATTAPFGINNRGQVVGQYVDPAGVLHGYLWEPKRGFRSIDPPGGATNACTEVPDGGRFCGTIAADINDPGQILLPAPSAYFKARVVPIGG
jgi:probable HAF family extracellular repeat protein